MALADIVTIGALTSVAFMVAYCVRTLFIDDRGSDLPVKKDDSDQYEPPRRDGPDPPGTL